MEEKKTLQLYTIKEVAELLRVDRVTIWRYIKQGKIKAIKILGTIRIPVDEINYLFPKSREEVSNDANNT